METLGLSTHFPIYLKICRLVETHKHSEISNIKTSFIAILLSIIHILEKAYNCKG